MFSQLRVGRNQFFLSLIFFSHITGIPLGAMLDIGLIKIVSAKIVISQEAKWVF